VTYGLHGKLDVVMPGFHRATLEPDVVAQAGG